MYHEMDTNQLEMVVNGELQMKLYVSQVGFSLITPENWYTFMHLWIFLLVEMWNKTT